jgi:class 3 adenylate cyclase
MAYFGWPAAHDNDAERAARAGLAFLDAIAKLNELPEHAKLATRVGIDSGTVLIGRGAGNEAEVFGDPPNIAARVREAAVPGTVAISDATHRLVPPLNQTPRKAAHPVWESPATRFESTTLRSPTPASTRSCRRARAPIAVRSRNSVAGPYIHCCR